jgi:hypothetical protein
MQTLQTIFIVLIVAAAAGYLIRRWVRSLRHKESCCSDCPGCTCKGGVVKTSACPMTEDQDQQS